MIDPINNLKYKVTLNMIDKNNKTHNGSVDKYCSKWYIKDFKQILFKWRNVKNLNRLSEIIDKYHKSYHTIKNQIDI